MTQPRIQSIKGYNSFSNVFKAGAIIKYYPLIASVAYDLSQIDLTPYRYEKMSQPNTLFIGVTISKRRAKKAVVRNRVKRLLRESVRLVLQEFATQDICINYKCLCLSWLKAPAKPSQICLYDVLPTVRDVMKRAINREAVIEAAEKAQKPKRLIENKLLKNKDVK